MGKKIWPKVTVIIVNWNGGHFLERCLSALLSQTVPPYEVILVDNASSDESLEIIKQFPSVRVLAQDKNLGFARGNNLAIEAASTESEWIALLNPDAFVVPGWLEALLSAVHDYPAFAGFGSKLLDATDPSVLDGAGDAYHISGLVWRVGHSSPVSSFSDEVREIFSPCAAAAIYRRSVLLEVGGFDEDYFCYVEDIDLGFRLRLAGYRCLYVPMAVAYHVGSATTGGQHSDFSVYHGHRNLVWTYVKNMPMALFWLLLPLQLLLNLITIGVFTARGQGRVILKAKWDAIKGLKQALMKRKNIQNGRVADAINIWNLLDKSFLPDKNWQGCHPWKKGFKQKQAKCEIKRFSMIDIIIVNYNSTDYLLTCLRSVMESLNGFHADIFVQDNASDDGVEKALVDFPHVKLTRNSKNIGFAAAVNQALFQGNNPYVMLLNPDTTVLDDFFRVSLEFMKDHPRTGIMGPKILEQDGKLQNSARSFPTVLTSFFGRTSFLTRIFPKNPMTLKNLPSLKSDGCTPMEVDWVSGACMIVNRKAIENVGGLDDRFFLYWEDADWCRRMWNSGWKVMYYPKAKVCHYTGASSKKELVKSVIEFHKSAYRLFEKHERSFLIFLKPFILSSLLIRAGLVLVSHWVRNVGNH